MYVFLCRGLLVDRGTSKKFRRCHNMMLPQKRSTEVRAFIVKGWLARVLLLLVMWLVMIPRGPP